MGKVYTGSRSVPQPYVREIELFPSRGGGLKIKIHNSSNEDLIKLKTIKARNLLRALVVLKEVMKKLI